MHAVAEQTPTLAGLWADALRDVVIRHPNPSARPLIDIDESGEPVLRISVSNHRDTGDRDNGAWESFTISNVRLTYFPGERLARAWIAAAWAGYLQHEALELVTVDGLAILNPHDKPYDSNPWNRGLRAGLPAVLNRTTLVAALATVMDREYALALMEWEE